ncbi:MAG TPA: NAD(P)-dependent oxidoreductase [Devosia sp.]|nr:NAD(P)-dependent oxidoreductase [Devosia sp.]
MNIFVAGATGTVGNRLLPMLLQHGHVVTALTRSPQKAEAVRAIGARPVIADGLDGDAIRGAVAEARPEIIIHQMSGLSGVSTLKNFDDEFAVTNRLRSEGTDILLAAAKAAGVRRFIAQSFGNWNYERTGAGPKAETDAFDPRPPKNQRQTLAAIRHLETAVTGLPDIEGIALRYANFYGPGTGFSPGGNIVEMVRSRRLPIVGNGAGIWSFIHIDDAAAATVAALTAPPGIYNIADDEPAPVAAWLPELARVISAKPPLRVPAWLGRLFIGEVGVSMMTEIRGALNTKAKTVLDWQIQFPSWRDGFRSVLEPGRG